MSSGIVKVLRVCVCVCVCVKELCVKELCDRFASKSVVC